MKQNPIKIFLVLSLFSSLLLSSSCEWSASINKKRVYTEEPVYLKYSCQFKERSELYAIDFNPVTDNENYTIKLLTQSEKIVDAHRIDSYEFVAFIHKAGRRVFEFDTIIKKTNKESIENSVIGRDNGEYEEFSLKHIKQKALSVEVIDAQSKIVGDLDIEIKQDEKMIKAYTPYHIEIILDGMVNFNALKPINFKIEGVKIFSQKPMEDIQLTKDGYKGRWSQKFAFVSEKSFTIPRFTIEYFNLTTKSKEKLIFKRVDVNVSKGFKKEELLDEETQKISYEYIYYLLTFITGFLVAQIDFKQYFKSKKRLKKDPFKEKIKSAKSLKEVAFLLALEDADKYATLILEIERGEIHSLKTCINSI